MGLSLGNGLLGSTGLTPGGGLSRGGGLYFSGFGPTYFADFIAASSTGVLPSGVTVSSPSLGALVTDASGKLTYKPNNLLTYSNTFSNAAWQLDTGSTIVGGGADPFAGSGAYTFTSSASTSRFFQIGLGGSFISVATFQTLYVKAGTATWFYIETDDTTGSSATITSFNIASGSVGTVNWKVGSPTNSQSNADISPVSGAPGWYKISVKQAGGIRDLAFGIANADATRASTAGLTAIVYSATVSAVTYETTPRPQDQVITGASAYYGPAFDHDSAGNPLGLRIWESRTNYALYSQNFSNAVWASFGGASVVGASSTPAPDGTLSAYEISPGTTGGTISAAGAVYQNINGLTSSQAYTFGIWMRAKTGTTTIRLSVNDGTTDTGTSDLTLTTTWQRFSVSNTEAAAAATGNIAIRNNTAGNSANILVWSANYQNGSFIGPDIPTGSAAVTTAADVVTLSGTPLALIEAASGSLIAETYNPTIIFNAKIIGTGASPGLLQVNGGGAYAVQAQSSSPAANSSATLSAGTNRGAISWNATGVSVTGNGATPSTASGAYVPPTAAYIGSANGAAPFLDGTIRKLAIYNSRLPDATLQAKSVVGAPF